MESTMGPARMTTETQLGAIVYRDRDLTRVIRRSCAMGTAVLRRVAGANAATRPTGTASRPTTCSMSSVATTTHMGRRATRTSVENRKYGLGVEVFRYVRYFVDVEVFKYVCHFVKRGSNEYTNMIQGISSNNVYMYMKCTYVDC